MALEREIQYTDKINFGQGANLIVTQAYVIIHCESGMEEYVIRNLKKIYAVKEVAGVFSLYDIIAKVEATNSLELEKIITKQVRKQKYIHTTITLIVIEEQENPKTVYHNLGKIKNLVRT